VARVSTDKSIVDIIFFIFSISMINLVSVTVYSNNMNVTIDSNIHIVKKNFQKKIFFEDVCFTN
ncbi:hypothetical protein, partial [Clostridium sp.]|uniref:hypothetical protein n=1 Tax=Clostridium sp. TaxID=1506 RepID=UPI0025C1A7CF